MGWALESRLGSRIVLGCKVDKMDKGNEKKNLLPSARHLEEGRETTILELLRRENRISRLCPRPLGSPPPPPPQHPTPK